MVKWSIYNTPLPEPTDSNWKFRWDNGTLIEARFMFNGMSNALEIVFNDGMAPIFRISNIPVSHDAYINAVADHAYTTRHEANQVADHAYTTRHEANQVAVTDLLIKILNHSK